MARAGAIIVENGKVALIERVRLNKTYYLFPGGKVEENESFETACKREVLEELGFDVTVSSLIAEVVFNDNYQYFFICDVNSGTFGSGTGEEYSGNLTLERGTYKPIWMDISELLKNDVRPKCVCEIILDGLINGFLNEVIRYKDLGDIQIRL